MPVSAEEAEAERRVKECFYENRRRYGSRRIALELEMGRFLVRRLMREQGLMAIQPRSFVPKTTDSNHNGLASPNLLKEKENQPVQWGEVVVGDITYVALINNGWAYLATFQDKLTRRVVGWAIAEHMRAELVIEALQMALRRGLIKRNAIVHTDRGSQYVSDDYRKLLAKHDIRQSMSAKGNCYDNARGPRASFQGSKPSSSRAAFSTRSKKPGLRLSPISRATTTASGFIRAAAT